jgi:putative addiction module antidote
MILELKLRKIGNSVSVVLPKEALVHLHAGEGDTLCVTEASDGSLRLCPTKPEVMRQLKAAEHIIRRYRSALRELAR